MNHILLNLRSLSPLSNGVIISIGAVRFDLNTGKRKATFHQNITIQSCLDIGLEIRGSVMTWWLQQPEKVHKDLLTNQVDIKQALNLFSEFVTKDDYIWSNSARFNCGLLENAYTKINKPICWDYLKERDLKTLFNIFHIEKPNDNQYNVLEDCYDEIKQLTGITKLLNISM